MAIIKNKDIVKMNAEEKKNKLDELRIELLKCGSGSKTKGKINPKEIKRTIARILTSNKLNKVNKTKEKK